VGDRRLGGMRGREGREECGDYEWRKRIWSCLGVCAYSVEVRSRDFGFRGEWHCPCLSTPPFLSGKSSAENTRQNQIFNLKSESFGVYQLFWHDFWRYALQSMYVCSRSCMLLFRNDHQALGKNQARVRKNSQTGSGWEQIVSGYTG